MKKIIAMLMVVVLVIPMCIFPANAEYDGEITFRGIPWGITYQEAIEEFEKTLRDGESVTWGPLTPFGYFGVFEFWKHRSEYQSIAYIEALEKDVNLMVAGYKVREIRLYFAFDNDANKTIVQDNEHTVFYMAEYQLEAEGKNDEEFLSIVGNKLTSIYGKSDDNVWVGLINFDIYKGIETGVWIGNSYYNKDKSYLKIRYYWDEGDRIAQNGKDVLIRQDHSGSDGL